MNIRHVLVLVSLCMLSLIVVPSLYIIATTFSITPVVIIVYSLVATFMDLPSMISFGGLSLNRFSQLLFALPTGLLLLLVGALCWVAIAQYQAYLKKYFCRKNNDDMLSKQQSQSAFSIIARMKSQAPSIIKTISIGVPALVLLLQTGVFSFAVIDKLKIDSYFTEVFFQKTISSGYARMWVISGLGSYSRLALWGSVATLLFIGTRVLLTIWQKKNKRKNVFVLLKLLLNTLYLVFVALVSANLLFVGYVNGIVGSNYDGIADSASYLQKIENIQTQIDDKNMGTTLALNKIMADITDNPQFFDAMGFDERIAVCEEINALIEQQEGPADMEQHYCRNVLNVAPASLDDILAEIASPHDIVWLLMEPEQSAYHMYGKDGEFNLKFVSQDGLFEAVYDKSGVLLTEKNDVINMGTYNYASPIISAEKHVVYDVLPYNMWGNVLLSRSYSDDDVLDNLDKFYANANAVERYKNARMLVEE